MLALQVLTKFRKPRKFWTGYIAGLQCGWHMLHLVAGCWLLVACDVL